MIICLLSSWVWARRSRKVGGSVVQSVGGWVCVCVRARVCVSVSVAALPGSTVSWPFISSLLQGGKGSSDKPCPTKPNHWSGSGG